MAFNEEREKMIEEGKSSRSEEKGRKMWAALEGFDRAALLVEAMLKKCKGGEDAESPLEDE